MDNQVKPLFGASTPEPSTKPVAQNDNVESAMDSLFGEEDVKVAASASPTTPSAPQAASVSEFALPPAIPVESLSPTQIIELQKQESPSTPKVFKGLTFDLLKNPDYGLLEVKVPAGQTLKVESSSMAYMSSNIGMKTKLKGGFGRFLTGENIFMNEFTAQGGSGEIGIAPAQSGAVEHIYLDNQVVYLQNSAFLASTMGVNVESKWQGLMKGFFSGESLFLIKCSGSGDLWFNSYGAILQIDVKDEYVVDTGYIVGFTEGLDYNVESIGGMKSLFFSGEGLVCRFRGEGKLWIQTRTVQPFLSWLHPFRPVKQGSKSSLAGGLIGSVLGSNDD